MTKRPDQHTTGLLRSFGYAFEGIAQTFEGRNFRIQLGVAVVVIIACMVLRVQAWAWCAVLVCVGMVLGAEAANTAIEALVDLASPQVHPLAKRAKDCAAAAALLCDLVSVGVGAVVFGPYLLSMFGLM